MTITTENNVKQYILHRIEKVYIGFDDNTEVVLKDVAEYDIDLDKNEYSTIELTNVFNDAVLENHFKGNKKNRVIYVHIEFSAVTLDHEFIKAFYDIPCDMIIKRLRANSDRVEVGDMFISLEGYVK